MLRGDSVKKVLVIFGTRPEAVKMAPVVYELLAREKEFDTKVCVTGQQRELLDQTMKTFDMMADFDLDIMKPGQDLYDVTMNVMKGLRDVFDKFRPDIVLVHGDTTTSFAAALSAFYERIPVGHVEAGLRTYKLDSPFPEELNRQITSKIAGFHFAPTEINRANLLREGVASEAIVVTGNTGIDALFMLKKRIDTDKSFQEQQIKTIRNCGYDSFSAGHGRKYILVTGHRRENFGEGFVQICKALKTIAEDNPEIDIVYPVHLNPNVLLPVTQLLGEMVNIYLLQPVPYEAFVYLMSRSHMILTDSGGIQEEAPSLNKPTLVMRDTTERGKRRQLEL